MNRIKRVGSRAERSPKPEVDGAVNRRDESVRQDGTIVGRNGTKLVCRSENQGKSREIKPPRGKCFWNSSEELRSGAQGSRRRGNSGGGRQNAAWGLSQDLQCEIGWGRILWFFGEIRSSARRAVCENHESYTFLLFADRTVQTHNSHDWPAVHMHANAVQRL